MVTDPFSGIGYDVKMVDCDYALSSHAHFDHNFFDGVNAGERIIGNHKMFKAIPCWHDEVSGEKRGKNIAFYFEVDGVKFLHLGDLGQPFDESAAEKFKLDVDVLFIPVGGNYTIDAVQAKKYVDYIRAKVIIPMHYKTERSNIDIAPVDDFLRLVEYKIVDNPIEITEKTIDNFRGVTVIKFK